jgi:hypothetical protein
MTAMKNLDASDPVRNALGWLSTIAETIEVLILPA